MKKLICLCSLLGLTPLVLSARTGQENAPDGGTSSFFSEADTLRDLFKLPVLAPFAARLLPWDNRPYNLDMKLSDIASLMPYHSHIHPPEILAGVNRLVADAQHGQTVFYDFYSAAQKQKDASKNNTGLFFFHGSPGAPFAIVCPGGGFAYVGSLHEGLPLAEQISRQGFNAFVIKYCAGSGQLAAEDLAAALEYIFAHAKELKVSVKDYSLWGGSAGARMAAAVGSYGTQVFGAKELPKPAAVIMAYTGQTSFTRQDPPTFIAVGEQDFIAPAALMKHRAEGLARAGVPVELHAYPGLGHGFGLGTATAAQGWVDTAVQFGKRFISEDKK